MKTKKTDKREELKDRALASLQQCLSDMGPLQDFREYALKAYSGIPIDEFGDELEELDGRSKVKMSDVADTVEWIMPTMMRIFYGGTKVCEVQGRGKEDEAKSRLVEELVNFQFMRQNDGFVILHDWFKDAMLSKMAVVKYWWEEKEEKKKREYEGLSEEEYKALKKDKKFEIVEEESFEVLQSDGLLTYNVKFYNVEGYELKEKQRPVAENIPPEEFIFDPMERDFTAESFAAHKKRVHKSYLKSKYDIDDDQIKDMVEAFDSDNIKDARFIDLDGLNFVTEHKDSDYCYIYECYLPDYDKNGNPVPMKVTVFGNEVIDVAENTYKKPPFCVLSAIRLPYRMVGRSLSELVMEIQKLRTALVRAIMDNIYYQNNGVKVINPYRIDLDDVIDHNHPGGVWRTLYDIDPSRAIYNVPVTPLAGQTFNMLEWVETIKENRTGVTKYNQGLDSKSLNKTATGISQIMGAAQQRMELIARIFAETGVKNLFQAFIDMNLEFLDSEVAVRLNEEWVDLSAEQIDGEFDLLVDVGVGTGSNEIKINQIIQMFNTSVPAMQMGIVTPDNMYNMISQVWSLMGYKNTDKFVTRPQPQGLPPELVDAAFNLLAQNGVDVNGLLGAAGQTLQGANGATGPGGQPPTGASPDNAVLPNGPMQSL